MGTKNEPGAYDCMVDLPDDEPFFALRGVGSRSAGLTRIYACLEVGDYKQAHRELEKLQKLRQRQLNNGSIADTAKAAEAFTCAVAMDQYAGNGEDEPMTADEVSKHPSAADEDLYAFDAETEKTRNPSAF